jgi:hypothetical protein
MRPSPVGQLRRPRLGWNPARLSRATVISLALVAVGSAVSLWLRAREPLRPAGLVAAAQDGGLYEREAGSLGTGHWLGPFDYLTLSKGPAYPTFLAITHRLGMTPNVGDQLTWLLGAACLAGTIYLITRRPILSAVAYLVLALDPVNYSLWHQVVMRDGWYASVSLLFLSSLVLAVYCVVSRRRWILALPVALLAGVSGAAVWLCREEGGWIVPSAAIVAIGLPAGRLVKWWFTGPRLRLARGQWARRVVPLVVTLGLVSIAFYVPIQFVKARNQQFYGVGIVTDATSGAFPRAYTDWGRVKAGPQRRYVPITKAMREAVYEVSPAARSLQSVLEDPDNVGLRWGCTSVQVCDDFAGGWEPWAIRQAIQKAGQLDSETEFQAFAKRLDNEIVAGCRDGRLRCRSRVPATLQPFLEAPVGPTVDSFFHWLRSTVTGRAYYLLPSIASYDHIDIGNLPDLPQHERDQLRKYLTGVPATGDEAVAQLRDFNRFAWVYRALGWIYRLLLPTALLLGLAGLVLCVAWRRCRGKAVLALLGAAFAASAVARLAGLAVIEAYQWRIGPRYHLVTQAFITVLAVIGLVALAEVLSTWLPLARRRRADRPGIEDRDAEGWQTVVTQTPS